MTDTPSVILVAAADRIRDLAAKATPGQWGVGEGGKYVWVAEDRMPIACSALVSAPSAGPDCEWIAALSPAVAPMIETTLRAAAATCAQAAREGWSDAEMRAEADDAMKAAFALADAILGSGGIQ